MGAELFLRPVAPLDYPSRLRFAIDKVAFIDSQIPHCLANLGMGAKL